MFRSIVFKGLMFAIAVSVGPGCAESPDEPTAADYMADIETFKVATPTAAMDMARTLIATYPNSPEAKAAASWLAEIQAASSAYNNQGAISAPDKPRSSSAPDDPDRAARIMAGIDAEIARQKAEPPTATATGIYAELVRTYRQDARDIANMTVKAQEMLRLRGVNVSLDQVLVGGGSIHSSNARGMNYADYLAAYVVLREEGTSHNESIEAIRQLYSLGAKN